MIGTLLYNILENEPDGIIISENVVSSEVFYLVVNTEDKSLNFLVRKDILLFSGIWELVKKNEKFKFD